MEKIKTAALYVFIVYVLNSLMEITVFNSMGDIIQKSIIAIRYLCYFLFLLKVVCDIIAEKKLEARVIFLALLSGAVVLSTDHIRLGAVALALVAMKNINIDKAIKYTMYALSGFFATVVILSLIGIIPDWQHVRGDTVRHALGFHYPTDTYSIFLAIVLMYIYSFKEKLNKAILVLLGIVSIILFYLTDGRMSFILVAFALLFAVIKPKRINKTVIALPILLTVLSFVAVALYSSSSEIGIKLNSVLSNRLMYSANALTSYPVSPFGTAVEWQGWGGISHTEIPEGFNYNFVDMSYIRMLFDYGIIASAIIIGLYTLLLKDLYKKGDTVTILVIVTVLLWSFVEPYIFSLSRNIFLLLFIPYLKKRRL